jgi:hypothetical protein
MRLIHIWCDYKGRSPEALGRHMRARQSWTTAKRNFNGLSGWISSMVDEDRLPRNSQNLLHEVKPLPFVKDIIDRGIANANGKGDDMILFTNDDIAMSEQLCDGIAIGPLLGWGTRYDFHELPEPLNYDTICLGQWHPGADLFYFTVDQWKEIRPEFPDMVYACQAWDLVLRRIIKEKGGVELPGVIAHELHPQWWVAHQYSPANRHNLRLAQKFFRSKNLPLA